MRFSNKLRDDFPVYDRTQIRTVLDANLPHGLRTDITLFTTQINKIDALQSMAAQLYLKASTAQDLFCDTWSLAEKDKSPVTVFDGRD